MNFEDRVKAVAEFGFTERQACFLVTVMLHSGVCVPRQYAEFAGTAYGHKVSKFFDKLARREFATVSSCLHNRAQLYHVRHHGLYCAIGQADSRYRRPVPARQAIERLMRLDGIVLFPERVYLATEDEKVAFFGLMAPSLPREQLPHITVGKEPAARVRLFPEDQPIAVTPTGRVAFTYVVSAGYIEEFRAFVQRHADLLRALPGWTLRVVFPRQIAGAIRPSKPSRGTSSPARCDLRRWPSSSGTSRSVEARRTCARCPSRTKSSGATRRPSTRRDFVNSTGGG